MRVCACVRARPSTHPLTVSVTQVTTLSQEFPARFGELSLFFTLSGQPPPAPAPSPAPPSPPQAPPPPPFNCSVFNCSCTGICDYYGIVNGVGFGCAPVEAQQFWDKHSCSCVAKKGLCSGVACKLPTNVCPCSPPSPSPCASYANGTAEPQDPRKFLPKAKHPWFQIPTRVEINGKLCSECLSQLTPRTLKLQGDLLRASGTSVAIHIYFGVLINRTDRFADAAARARSRKIVSDGDAAASNWETRQAARSVVLLQSICIAFSLCVCVCLSVCLSVPHSYILAGAGINRGCASRVHAVRCCPGECLELDSFQRCDGSRWPVPPL